MKSQTVSQKLLALKPSIRLTIGNPTAESSSLFGPGVAALCNGVQERGSLNAAAKAMGSCATALVDQRSPRKAMRSLRAIKHSMHLLPPKPRSSIEHLFS